MRKSGEKHICAYVAVLTVDERCPCCGIELCCKKNESREVLAGESEAQAIHKRKMVHDVKLHVSAEGGMSDGR